MRQWMWAAVVLATVAVAGCGEDGHQKTYPVTGRVLLDGQPVAGATVVLHPVDKTNFKRDERPQGRTDDAGNFTLFTYVPGDGAPAGQYKAAIAVLATEAESGSDQVKRSKGPAVPAKYGHQDKSGLDATVSAGATTLPPFELSSK